MTDGPATRLVWTTREQNDRAHLVSLGQQLERQGLGWPSQGDRQAVLDAFESLRVKGESMSSPVNMVALDIAPDAPLASVKSLLVAGESDGRWHYEEGCITEEWLRLA